MAKNTRQHIESQFVIRNFLGGRHKLFCLDKATLTVKDRVVGNIPSQILTKDHYYTTDDIDFDVEVVQPLERQMGLLLPQLVSDHASVMRDPAVLQLLAEWSALAQSRSILFDQLVPYMNSALSPDERADLPANPKSVTLIARRIVFEELKRRTLGAGLFYGMLRAPIPFGFLLTDHPPAAVPFGSGGLGPLLLPLSHELMLVQVPQSQAEEFHRKMGDPSLGWLTIMQCGWAERLIYSADLATLDFATEVIRSAESFVGAAMATRSRQPHFGFASPAALEATFS